MILKLILIFFGVCTLLYLLFFAIVMGIGTQSIPQGHAAVRTGWGGLTIGLGSTLGGSLFLNKIRFLDVQHLYPVNWENTLTTADQQQLTITYNSTWNIISDETTIKILVQQIGVRKVNAPDKIQHYLQKQFNKTFAQLSQTSTVDQWHQQTAILAALRQKGQQLGLQVQNEQLTIKT